MNLIEPDFNNFVEAEIKIDTYSGDPDQWVIYEQNEKDVYYPSFIRYGEFAINTGAKVLVEAVENGFIIKSGGETRICEDNYTLETNMRKHMRKIVEKERDLTEDEVEELTTMTLKINTHFAAQSVR